MTLDSTGLPSTAITVADPTDPLRVRAVARLLRMAAAALPPELAHLARGREQARPNVVAGD